MGRWLHLLTRLFHWLKELRRPRRCDGWNSCLRALLVDLFGEGGAQSWELPLVLAAIDDWQQAAAGCDLKLEAAVVAAVLDESLAADSGRFGHRSGALTISALEPMRASIRGSSSGPASTCWSSSAVSATPIPLTRTATCWWSPCSRPGTTCW